ncbi:hypothetical protein BJY00DRAFT_312199 [Aspergillus carlsbadensis]|nr:hypothetical protein BJY00DRAFT_312199 [Aspergillus carlsbadensis]
MADPLSIIGTAGALANIIQLATQTITAIHELQSDWKDADLAFLSLTGQLSSLRLALTKIEEWMALEAGAHYQLVMDLDDSIKCCKILLMKLQELTNALNLLLTACNCKTGTEQKALLERSSSQKVLRQTHLDSASLIAQYDTSSIASQLTDTLSKLSLVFSFDRTLFTSNVYERFFRGLTKRNLEISQTRVSPTEQRLEVGNEWELYKQGLLFIGGEYSGIAGVLDEVADTWKDEPLDLRLKFQQMAVYRSVILSMKAILTALNLGGIRFQSDINMDHSAFLLRYVDDMVPTKLLDERVGEVVRSLWHDPCTKTVRQSPRDFGITDLTLYLLDEHNRIFSREYRPTSQDMQAVQHRTPATMEVHVWYKVHRDALEPVNRKRMIVGFQVRDVTLRFRSNRPYCFKAITTILLPVDLAGYDNIIVEEEPRWTALLHSISDLRTALQSAWFPRDKIIGMLLRRPADLDTRLTAHRFADYYPGYTGVDEPDMVEAAVSCDLMKLPFQPYIATVIKEGEWFPELPCVDRLIALSELLWLGRFSIDSGQGEAKDD